MRSQVILTLTNLNLDSDFRIKLIFYTTVEVSKLSTVLRELSRPSTIPYCTVLWLGPLGYCSQITENFTVLYGTVHSKCTLYCTVQLRCWCVQYDFVPTPPKTHPLPISTQSWESLRPGSLTVKYTQYSTFVVPDLNTTIQYRSPITCNANDCSPALLYCTYAMIYASVFAESRRPDTGTSTNRVNEHQW